MGSKPKAIWHGNCLWIIGGAISNKTGVQITGDNMKKYVGIWLDHREAFVETADKMTIRQIAAKVREFFKPHL